MPSLTPSSERPRERCLEKGPSSLSLRECLALLIHTGPPGVGCLGLASHLLERAGEGIPEHELQRAFFTAMETEGRSHLQSLEGLGPAAQARILAAFELARNYAIHHLTKTASPEKGERPRKTPADQALSRIPSALRLSPQEWIGFVPAYSFRNLGNLCLVERGVRTHVNFEPSELFARVLALRPAAFFLFHNHPEGSLLPSRSDLALTDQVHQTASLLGLRLMGHGIVTPTASAWIQLNLQLNQG